VGFLLAFASSVLGDTTSSRATRLLPDRIGKLRKVSSRPGSSVTKEDFLPPRMEAAEKAEFIGNDGAKVNIEMIRFGQDAYAYEFLSLVAARARQTRPDLKIQTTYGTAGFVSDNEFAFFKGNHFVGARFLKEMEPATRDELISELSANLHPGEGDIPVLIKHLPNPEEAQKTAIYLHSFNDLHAWFGIQSGSSFGFQSDVFSAIETERNADAVLAAYGPTRVFIVEFNTPQLAAENDKRIIARIQELWKQGRPAPTAYRRVGNYSVFVFDAPDEQTAKRLIDEVKYEQVVQWLGENPNIYKEAEKYYMNTTLGVLVAVVKASGYALIACLGLGGLVGGLLFTYRRSQQKAVTYSDAGGMLRLNLDDLTVAQSDPARLLRERN
jgi:hypothetical protein